MQILWTRRKGVSTMIGGIIILTLFLSALSVMVFISQQYDSYQSTVETMNRKDIDAFSENLVPVYPGLSNATTTCGSSSCTEYILYISNDAAIGTQITRIYINSTDQRPYISGTQGPGVGCSNLCVFDASDTPRIFDSISTFPVHGYFLAASAFVNPSEYSHQLIFYTNDAYTLPSDQPGNNSIAIVTSRGRAFSFNWPIKLNPSKTVTYLTTGVMKIAYDGSGNPGFSSKNEMEPIIENSGGTANPTYYCHSETSVTEVGLPTGNLWFVNPWVTLSIFKDAFPLYGQNSGGTSFYVSVEVTNSQGGSITITEGNIWLQLTMLGNLPANQQSGLVLVMGGPLVGTWYHGVFTPPGSVTTVIGGDSVLLIYRINAWNWNTLNLPGGALATLPSGVTYSGMATMTNDQEGTAYFSGTSVVDGLYVRSSC